MKLFKVLSLTLLVASSLNAVNKTMLMCVGACGLSEVVRHHDMETKKRGGKPGMVEEIAKDCTTAMAGGVLMNAVQGKDMDIKSMAMSTITSYVALKLSKMPSLVELAGKIPVVRAIMCNENVGDMMRFGALNLCVTKCVEACKDMFKAAPSTPETK